MFVFLRPMKIVGNSMNPTYQNGDIVFVNTAVKKYITKDIVVLYYGQEKIIKRIYGLYGDYIKITQEGVYINEEYITENRGEYTETEIILLEDEFFVLGDNYSESIDSRYFGAIKYSQIIGKVICSL